MEELQLHKFLSNFFIRSHSIPSIGETRKLTLSSFGIDTAADVNKLKRFKVPGFGSFLEGQLFHWRNTLAKRFKFVPSRGIDPEDVNHLNKKFENLKLEYQNKLVGGVEALMTIKSQILRNRASLRSQVEIVGKAYHQAEVDWKKVE
jgi:DNA-binding helix-hairpin-helix protein with protein kinase domain